MATDDVLAEPLRRLQAREILPTEFALVFDGALSSELVIEIQTGSMDSV